MNNVKNIQVIVKVNVDMAGYKKVVEDYGLARGLTGCVFNISKDTVALMAGGLESAIDGFIQDLKVKRPDTEIKTMEIKEDIILPSPFGRVISGDMREIGERLDKGVNILSDHTGLLNDLKENTSILTEHTGSLNKHTELLQGINDNFNTLPERIAEAIMKR